LEVLDWGGPRNVRALVFLSRLGDTAHVFDKFAPSFTHSYHVLGVTRCGFGKFSAPPVVNPATYSADRLGDDVIAVIDHLRLQRPILVGHSIAGEELRSIGSRNPEKVAGLVYLDAGYGYAFYGASRGDLYVDLFETRKKLELMQPGKGPNDTRPVIPEHDEGAAGDRREIRESTGGAETRVQVLKAAPKFDMVDGNGRGGVRQPGSVRYNKALNFTSIPETGT
jgi:pimeloyl-ACP methyl ester carboxylesterase